MGIAVGPRRGLVGEAGGDRGARRGEGRLTAHRTGEIEKHRAGDLEVTRVRPAANASEAGGAGPALDGAEKPGLPDPGFTGKELKPPSTEPGRGEAVIGEHKEPVSTDEHRTDKWDTAFHRAQV